jgi:hypothetical protein
MIRLKILVISLLMCGATLVTKAQDDNSFKPHGKPVFLVYSNVHSTFNRLGNNEAFELTRAYLGYEYFFSPKISTRANIDIADPGTGSLQMTAFIKNAFLQYKDDHLTILAGMIPTYQYNLLEKEWGYRYIIKSFQDEYGFGPSADLGATTEYAPSKSISFDASVLNGEGYKRIQSDSTFKYAFGITLRPAAGVILRAYTDFMKKEYLQNTISLFASYSLRAFNAGIEYDFQKNNRMLNNHDYSGISAWVSYRFDEKCGIFARYDNLRSETPAGASEPWNLGKDGQLILAGFDYSPAKGVKIAPVYMGWSPASSKPFTSTAGLYFEIRL